MATKIVLLGAGGHARDVLDVLEAANEERSSFDIIGFVVDTEFYQPGVIINEKPLLGDFHWLEKHLPHVRLIAAVGRCELRRHLVERARKMGGRFSQPVIHPTAVLTRRVTLLEGSVVGAGVTVTSLVRIGEHAHINNACSLAHDVEVGNFATLSPGVRVSGNVLIGEGTYVGTGASIIEKVQVGSWSIVGAGSSVIRDVPSDVTAVGCPARIIKRRPLGWHLRPAES